MSMSNGPSRLVAVRSAAASRRLTASDRARFESHLREILAALGLELKDEGTRDTPARLLDAWIDATSGYDADAKLATSFAIERMPGEHGNSAQVVEGPIPLTALCEHHALPFFGRAWVGYVAAERLIGLSKLTRIVRQFSRRFTMQERIGREVAAALESIVSPRGVAVRIEAAHLCTRMRGVRESDAMTSSTIWHGVYEGSESLRREFLELCAHR
jgi:GTP cyclohydrolase I